MRHAISPLSLVFGLVFGTPVWADSDSEYAALERLARQIEQLQPLVRQAQAQSDERQPVQFRYDRLQDDLSRISQAIDRHLHAPRREPQPIEPLDGDYRQKVAP